MRAGVPHEGIPASPVPGCPDGLPTPARFTILAAVTGDLAYGTHTTAQDNTLTTVTTWAGRALTGLAGVPVDPAREPGPLFDRQTVDVAPFLRRVVSGCPDHVEVLFVPDVSEGAEPPGGAILECRNLLVTAEGVEHGYVQQIDGLIERLTRTGAGRLGEDEARWCARAVHRLAAHLEQLWLAGVLTIRLDDPGVNVEFGESVVSGGDVGAVLAVRERVSQVLAMPSGLPLAVRPAVHVAEVLCSRARSWADTVVQGGG